MSHTIRTGRVVASLLLVAAVSVELIAQTAIAPRPEAAPTPLPSSEKALVQLRVQVTISRYNGDKKTVSLPFTLWVNADGEAATLNAGQNVPVPATTFSSGGTGTTPVTSYSIRSVGTQIACRATPSGDGRLKVILSITDSHLAPAKASGEMVTTKSLETHNSLLLRSGQTAEFVASTDMVTGEVTRIEVTATVLK